MSEIKQAYNASNNSLNVTGLNGLVPGSVALSDEIDNTILLNLARDVDVTLANTTATSGKLDVYMMGSNTSEDYGSAASTDTSLHTWILSINPSLTTPKSDFRWEQVKKYGKLMFVNNTNDALSGSGNSVNWSKANLTN